MIFSLPPVLFLCVVAAFYLIRLGQVQIERGCRLGLLSFIGGSLLACIGVFGILFGALWIQYGFEIWERASR